MRSFAQKPKASHPATSVQSTLSARALLRQRDGANSIHRGPANAHAKPPESSPADIHEQEAERVSEQVMRMPELQLPGARPARPTQRLGQQPGSLQTRPIESRDAGHAAVPPVVHAGLRSPGQALDAATRAFMEPRFGHDFSRVRIHTGAAAEESARGVNADAYTVGTDVVFGAGRFAPQVHAGRRLIAHELAHVVQQQNLAVTMQRQPARSGGASGSSKPAIDVADDQLAIIQEGQLPLEFFEKPDIRALSISERQDMEFKRKWDAILKLGELRDQHSVFTLVAILEDKVFPIKRFPASQQFLLKQAAAESLGKIGGKIALTKLSDLLKSKDPAERKIAALALPGVAGGQAAGGLLTALQTETDADLRARLIFALGNAAVGVADAKEKEAIAAELIRQMEKDKDVVRLAAVSALGKVRVRSATEPLLKLLTSTHDIEALAAEIVDALGEIGDERAVDLVVVLLKVHVKKRVRIEAALALGKIGGAKARAALKERLNLEADADVKAAIQKATTPVIRQTFN